MRALALLSLLAVVLAIGLAVLLQRAGSAEALGPAAPSSAIEGKLRLQLHKERAAWDRLRRRYLAEIRALRRVARDVRYPTPAGNRRLARAYFGPSEYACAAEIIDGETAGTWRHDVAYGLRYGEGYIYSGLAFGLGQARPGTKMLAYGADAASNPLTQLRWFRGYAEGRYGSVCGAAAHWNAIVSW